MLFKEKCGKIQTWKRKGKFKETEKTRLKQVGSGKDAPVMIRTEGCFKANAF